MITIIGFVAIIVRTIINYLYLFIGLVQYVLGFPMIETV